MFLAKQAEKLAQMKLWGQKFLPYRSAIEAEQECKPSLLPEYYLRRKSINVGKHIAPNTCQVEVYAQALNLFRGKDQ